MSFRLRARGRVAATRCAPALLCAAIVGGCCCPRDIVREPVSGVDCEIWIAVSEEFEFTAQYDTSTDHPEVLDVHLYADAAYRVADRSMDPWADATLHMEVGVLDDPSSATLELDGVALGVVATTSPLSSKGPTVTPTDVARSLRQFKLQIHYAGVMYEVPFVPR